MIGVVGHFWNGVIVMQAPHAVEELARAAVGWSGRTLAGLIGPWQQVTMARSALGALTLSTHLDSKEILYTLSLSNLKIPNGLIEKTQVCRRA
ncbi:MAG TPA: GNAT family N-acetyltransferase, partial [Gammaproteobacteria bacterium]|nr:GNAT family N-acetyltransferase [Gammaproteobacteria bacterium]